MNTRLGQHRNKSAMESLTNLRSGLATNSIFSVSFFVPSKGFLELTRRPSLALDSPRASLPELQRYKDTVRCATLGEE